MLEFRAQRRPGQSFGSRYAYLGSKTGEDFPYARWLCHAIANVNYPLRTNDDLSNGEVGDDGAAGDDREVADGQATKDDETARRPEPTRGFPWVTFVVGSGCLEARDASSMLALERLPAAVAGALAGRPRLADDSSPSRLAASFTRSLIKDRLDIEVDPDVQAESELPVETAELVLLAALLNRFFHKVKALGADAPSRWSDDVAVLPNGPRETEEIRSAVVDPARELVAHLTDSLTSVDEPVARALGELLRQIHTTFSPSEGSQPMLYSVDLRVLAECSWYLLTRGTTIYPGWSDLLLELSMSGRFLPAPHVGPRPAFDSLDFGPDLIAKRYLDVTRASWDALRSTSPDLRITLCDRAAEMLRAQAELRSQVKEGGRKPPLASMFITTFDLEVEMALWNQDNPGPFVMAIPVYVFRGDEGDLDRSASLCWLGAVVRPDHNLPPAAQLERLLDPSEWFVLSNMKQFDRVYGDLPVIVRLSGCPLVKLPVLADETGRVGPSVLHELVTGEEGQSIVPIAINHAVLLNEYVAMQHIAIEQSVVPSSESRSIRHYGLPEEITGVKNNKRTYARFWMVMGVQMGDSGVRYCVTSQIASPHALLAVGGGSGRPRRAGVVVNRRLDVSEQNLLYWHGFDVVRVPCPEFGDDLAHYVRHLRDPDKRTSQGRPCPLP